MAQILIEALEIDDFAADEIEPDTALFDPDDPKSLGLDSIDALTKAPTRFKGLPAGTRAVQLPDNAFESYFLTVFGRPDSASACECERSIDATLRSGVDEYEPRVTEDGNAMFFVRGRPYRLWGLFETNLHLFGLKDPEAPLLLFGTDRLGRGRAARRWWWPAWPSSAEASVESSSAATSCRP